MLIDSTQVYGEKVFIKIQDNGNKEEIKHLSQLTRKFTDHIFNFDDQYSPLFTKGFLLQVSPGPCHKHLVWHVEICNLLTVLVNGFISDGLHGVDIAIAIIFMVTDPEAVFKRCSLF